MLGLLKSCCQILVRCVGASLHEGEKREELLKRLEDEARKTMETLNMRLEWMGEELELEVSLSSFITGLTSVPDML